MAALTLGHAPVAAQEPVRLSPATQSFMVGALKISVLRDGRIAVPNDGSVFGGKSHTAELAALLRSAGRDPRKVDLDNNILLVRTPGRVVLIDAGYGTQGKGVLTRSLKLLGVPPAAVTDVLITHAHPDHIGGLVDATGRRAFPNAVVRMSTREWRFMQRQAATRAIAAAIRSQLSLFVPGNPVLPGIRSIALYGHTPGHVMYELSSGGDRLLDVGDAAHSSIVSLARPDWPTAWDSDRALGARQRRSELAKLASSHERMFVVHFPFPGVGYVVRKGHAFEFRPMTFGAAVAQRRRRLS